MPDQSIGQQYAQSVRSWQQSVSEFEEAMLIQANATADYKQARGRFIVRLRFEEPKISAVALEAAADGDDVVGKALHDRLLADAVVDSLKQRLQWHRAQADNLRTQVVDEREQNRFSSAAGAGPGRGQVDPTYDRPGGRSALPPPDPWPSSDPWADGPPQR
jgi:hypothetical protein